MKKLRSVGWVLLATTITVSSMPGGSAGSDVESESGVRVNSEPTAVLQAATGATILFRPQDGPVAKNASPEGMEVPHLALRRNGVLTEPDERTLVVTVTGIKVPPAGATVTLYVETQHGDPDSSEGSVAKPAEPEEPGPQRRIRVWQEVRWIDNPTGVSQTRTAVFTHTFQEAVISGTRKIPTPSDYFRYDVTVSATGLNNDSSWPGEDRNCSSYLHSSGDYAFLMEDQCVARLPDVPEAADGAAPDELVIYFLDMVPFGKDAFDGATWLAREDVPSYVSRELVPRMVEAFRVQSEDWGFPWHDAWTSFRAEDPERLSVALTDRSTYFHGRAPRRGHAGISIKVSGGHTQYPTLTDGLMSNFRHELFHSLQRNINQNSGGDGNVDGAENAWQFFSEGTAVLASSIAPMGQPSTWDEPAYMLHANPFIGYSDLLTDLNRSYTEIIPYRAAFYWRFLYEQCGYGNDATLDPAAGMEVIRRALTILYSGEVVDIGASTDLVGALPEIMDGALSGSSCPFQTHAESLAAFARAIYALQLDGGRCASPRSPSGCGLYDPQNRYFDPPISTVGYSEANQGYAGQIASSFGMDLVDVTLDGSLNGQPLEIEFHSDSGSAAAFTVQVWEVRSLGEGTDSRPLAAGAAGPRTLVSEGPDGELSTVIAPADGTGPNVLGLIITRIDEHERVDRAGAYTVVVHPADPGEMGTAERQP